MHFLDIEHEKNSVSEWLNRIPSTNKDSFENILYTLYQQNLVIDQLRKENEKLKSEHYKDDKIKEVIEKNNELKDELRRGFYISEEEDKKLNEWISEHEKIHKGGHGCSGGKYTYIFTPTSLGTFGTIKCSCGKSFDFQELS